MKGLSRKFFFPTHYGHSAYFSSFCLPFLVTVFLDMYFVFFPLWLFVFCFNRFEVLESRRAWHAQIRGPDDGRRWNRVDDELTDVSQLSWLLLVKIAIFLIVFCRFDRYGLVKYGSNEITILKYSLLKKLHYVSHSDITWFIISLTSIILFYNYTYNILLGCPESFFSFIMKQ